MFFQITKLQTLRKFAFSTQNGRCFYCGLPMWEYSDQAAFASRFNIPKKLIPLCQSTAEHLRARSKMAARMCARTLPQRADSVMQNATKGVQTALPAQSSTEHAFTDVLHRASGPLHCRRLLPADGYQQCA